MIKVDITVIDSVAENKGKLVCLVAAVVAFGAVSGAVLAEGQAAGTRDLNQTGAVEPAGAKAHDSNAQAEGYFAVGDKSGVDVTGKELYLKMILSVLLVIVLGAVAIYASRKLLPRLTHLSGREIRVVETVHIGPHKGIHIVEVGGRRLVIGSTNENIRMLADVTEGGTDFSTHLAESMRK